MVRHIKAKKEEVRVDGRLKEVITLHDAKGNILHRIISPLAVEFQTKDLLQVTIGAIILAIPVGFTEETWTLGQELHIGKVLAFMAFSLVFMAAFIYYNSYRGHMRTHHTSFLKRVFLTYLISFVVVTSFLALLDKAPWSLDPLLAFKRTVLVAFPASLSAAVVDVIK